MKDVARVWERRIGKRRGVLKERNDRGKERRTGGSLGWRTELEYAKEPWLKKKRKGDRKEKGMRDVRREGGKERKDGEGEGDWDGRCR